MAKTKSINRKKDTPPDQISPQTEACNQAAQQAYWFATMGLIPIVGLVFGPIAIVLGLLAKKKARADSEFTLWGPVWASIYFGLAITVCNWVGVGLMIIGLRSMGVW